MPDEAPVTIAIFLIVCSFMSGGSSRARKTFRDGISADRAEMPSEEAGRRWCEPLEQDAHVATVVREIAHLEMYLGGAARDSPAKEFSHQRGP
jgi:hypothetical protein